MLILSFLAYACMIYPFLYEFVKVYIVVFQYDELTAKGDFDRESIVTALTANDGDLDAAFTELNKIQLRPFLMRIWGQPEPAELASGQSEPEINASIRIHSDLILLAQILEKQFSPLRSRWQKIRLPTNPGTC